MAIGLSSGTVANIRNFGREGFENFFPKQVRDSVYGKQASSDGLLSVEKPRGNRGLFDSLYDATLGRIPGLETSEQRDRNVYREKVAAVPEEGEASSYSARIRGLKALLPTASETDAFKINEKIVELEAKERKEISDKLTLAKQLAEQKNLKGQQAREKEFIEQSVPVLEGMLLGNKQELSDEDKLLSIIFASPETTNAKRREILINVKKARDVTLAGREQQLSYLEALPNQIKEQPEIANMIDSLKDKSVDKFETGQISNAIERAKNNIEENEFLNGLTKSIEKPNSKPILKEIKENLNNGLYDVTHAKRILEAIRKSDLDKRPEKINIQSHTLNNEIVDTGYDKRGRLVYYNSSLQKWELLPQEGTRVGKGPTNITRKSHLLNGELVTTGLRKVGNVTEEVYLNKETGTWEALPETAEIATSSSTKSVKGRITPEERKDFGEVKDDEFVINNTKVKALFRRAGVDFKPFEDYGKTGYFDLEFDLEDEEIKNAKEKYIEDVILEARRLEKEENIQYNRALIKAIKTISFVSSLPKSQKNKEEETSEGWSARQITGN